MRIPRDQNIRLSRKDRPRRIDAYIDYFGGATGPSLLEVATPAPVRWEQRWRRRVLSGRQHAG